MALSPSRYRKGTSGASYEAYLVTEAGEAVTTGGGSIRSLLPYSWMGTDCRAGYI